MVFIEICLSDWQNKEFSDVSNKIIEKQIQWNKKRQSQQQKTNSQINLSISQLWLGDALRIGGAGS
jgi:hypothetical protein